MRIVAALGGNPLLGGTFAVAVVGAVFSSVYGPHLASSCTARACPHQASPPHSSRRPPPSS